MIEHTESTRAAGKECFMKLSDMLSELEIKQERAQAMSDELAQDYFLLKEDVFKCYYHDRARILNEIVFDYLNQMGDILNEVEELMSEYEHKQAQVAESEAQPKEEKKE